MPQRHSIGDYEQIRPQSGGNLQKFYANQRHQPRQNEAEQMMQAKRRMAAQRERELRNYHQEQQYNRSESCGLYDVGFSDQAIGVPSDSNSQGKSDRAISPNTMNEEDRRELIARQHRALYGNEAAPSFEGGNFGDESHTPRPSQSASGNTSAAGGRGPSPHSYELFLKGQAYAQGNKEDGAGQLGANDQNQQQSKGPSPKPQQQRSRDDCTSSPASNPPGQNFNLFEAAQQSSRTSTSSPGGSPPRQAKASVPGVAPIGTRPQTQVANPALNKRSGTPSQSPLSYGFASNTETLNANPNGNERSTSSASNPASGTKDSNVSAWGTGSGVWGNSNNNNNKSLGVQASVWG